jgi:hypothetical protein
MLRAGELWLHYHEAYIIEHGLQCCSLLLLGMGSPSGVCVLGEGVRHGDKHTWQAGLEQPQCDSQR